MLTVKMNFFKVNMKDCNRFLESNFVVWFFQTLIFLEQLLEFDDTAGEMLVRQGMDCKCSR